MILLNPVVLSVIAMVVLCLLGFNVILALIVAALVAGFLAGMPVIDTMNTLIAGMGGNAETALSYILLGALAAAIHESGLAAVLSREITKVIKGRSIPFILLIAFVTIFSQNLIPIHIAFIPILIPPLLYLMNKMKIDRRAMACALTFGLKAPYITIPIGFGLIFHGIIASEMTANGIPIDKAVLWKALWFPGLAMLVGLLFAVFISYRKPREYMLRVNRAAPITEKAEIKLNRHHFIAIVAALIALSVQLTVGSLPLGAICGIIFMAIFRTIKWKGINSLIDSGIGMMGFIAFVMLIASGYGNVIRESGCVPVLISETVKIVGTNKIMMSTLLIIVGLFITVGIGSSFGTIPIIAVVFVPIAISTGYSPMATAILIGTAAALGDAGSPASDSTLGPTSGLNADGQHDHIWDTCVPTFLHFNIPLVIFGIVGSLLF